ncbi:hypothetical protein K432DRAFT_441306 [Lepidopterella palustris CBS 459.81]|uniref:MARVEL domain-containing protein n=1 Tax=Lepidopterella palustris CBS 459.81 TaxID=1314670 RepID=A0A8E2EFH0_9PEZI|nr:hypothetical protein K432DRAFT_441306 [Lepidopterella palustris CBS 459.81]
MPAVKFSTATEWVLHYQSRAQQLLRYTTPDRETLRADLHDYAQETIDASILSLEESKSYELTIAGGMAISAIGTHLASKKGTEVGVVMYARKVLTLLGLADASAVGRLFKEALMITNELPESSSWIALIVKEAKEYLDDKQTERLKEHLKDWWDTSNINDIVEEELAEEFGVAAAHEAMDLLHSMHLFGVIYKGIRGAVTAKERLDKACTIMRARAVATHQKIFVEVAISRALLNSKSSHIQKKPLPTRPSPPFDLQARKPVAVAAISSPPQHLGPRPTNPTHQLQSPVTLIRENTASLQQPSIPPKGDKDIRVDTAEIPLQADERASDPSQPARPPIVRFRSKAGLVLYIICRICQVLFSFALLGLTADIIRIPHGGSIPPVLGFFLFAAIWSVLVLLYRGAIACNAALRSTRLLVLAEFGNLVNTFCAAVVYAVAMDSWECLSPGQSDWPHDLLWYSYSDNENAYDWVTIPTGLGMVDRRCYEEFASLLFFWLLFVAYVGSIVTVNVSAVPRDGS